MSANPIVSLITCTGARPDAFALCEKYMAAQTYQNFEWIVIDDSAPKTKCTMKQRYFRGPEDWAPELNTQRVNMRLALQKVKGSFIFVIEDDDYYHPTYLQQMLSSFSHSKLVGISNARYYKVDFPGYAQLDNFKHASLSQTAFTRDLIPMLSKCVESGNFFFDIELWKAARKAFIPMTLIANTNLSVGIKGLPGRPGLTRGHKENNGFLLDPGHKKLHEWLGSHVKNYEPFLRKPLVKKSVAG